MRALITPLVAVVLLLASVACGNDRVTAEGDGRFALPGVPVTSPSGSFEAHVNPSGNLSMYVSITDKRTGAEVYKDVENYSTSRLHGYTVGWLSSAPEQLWIYSADVGTSRVDRSAEGEWEKSRRIAKVEGHMPDEILNW
ncbi:hypothetical protein ACFVVM_02550 [Nocardia sp. NPDC058176]|uniref:hypothetical protein n=1 Tax=Nocardia sp. NPDC058176 TaxID=3346368 RepID=UPI0036D76156